MERDCNKEVLTFPVPVRERTENFTGPLFLCSTHSLIVALLGIGTFIAQVKHS